MASRDWQGTLLGGLAEACRAYIDRVSDLIGAPIRLIGTGPRRDQFVTRGAELFA